MPKMNAQNSTPKNPSTRNRAFRPALPPNPLVRAVRTFGPSRWNNEGSGRATLSSLDELRIQHLDQLTRRVLARELEEDVLEARRAGFGVLTQLVHRTAGANLPTLDDPDAIA